MRTKPSDLQPLFERVKNWGRWGPEDERGTLNYLTGDEAKAAAALVQAGRTVSLSRNFPTQPGPENPWPAHHHMVIAGDDPCVPGFRDMQVSTDYIGIAFHGMASSHLDALCHVFHAGQMYNGHPASDVRSTGARRNTVMTLKDGVAGRGVLLDVPRALGIAFVDAERLIGVAELERAQAAEGLTIGKGDIVLIRLGRDARREAHVDGRMAGLDPEVAEWLHERQAAILGGDGVHDPMPPARISANWPMPIHMIGLAAMGLHLLDNLNLEDVAAACTELGRWAFLLVLAPLRIEGGTGSPLNPIALF